jgi:uncharacterized lipoprotein YajG
MKSTYGKKVILAALVATLVMLAGCAKKMSDQKFVAVANMIYENVQANWDHQESESWATYYDRRIAEACAKNGTSPREWDDKMEDVKAHPDKYAKLLDKEELSSILEWQGQREAAKGS